MRQNNHPQNNHKVGGTGSGEIRIDDRLVFGAMWSTSQHPSAIGHDISILPWPHMTVFRNVAFGLEGKMAKDEIISGYSNLANVQMAEYVQRYPSNSAGAHTAVALARMLAAQPEILLMDEPLSNLDAKLRMQMRAELKRMHNDLDVTVVYVTHDQEEALTLSTKVAVMNNGVIEQYDAPSQVYKNPASLFVADFMGNPQMNFLKVTSSVKDGGSEPRFATGKPASAKARQAWIVSSWCTARRFAHLHRAGFSGVKRQGVRGAARRIECHHLCLHR